MIDVCVNHGKVDSPLWRITAKGRFCGECFKPQKTEAGILTRTSQRVVQDQAENKRELIQPFVGGKVNEEFARQYPEEAQFAYSDRELKDVGSSKLKSRKGETLKESTPDYVKPEVTTPKEKTDV